MSNATTPAPEATSEATDRMKGLAQEIYALVRTRHQVSLAVGLQRSAALMTGRAQIVAVGTRSVGKSSLLNAVLDRDGLLPVEVDVTSNVYVRVGYGVVPEGEQDPGEGVRVTFSDEREPLMAELGELAGWASEAGNPNNEKRVSQVGVRVLSSLTEQGIVLIDTPGAGGLVSAHADAVRSACRHADGLLVVLDHVQPLSATVLDFLRSLGDLRRVVFAFNKTDIPGETARSIADTQRHLDRAELSHLAAAPMIPTSAFLYREANAFGEDGRRKEVMLADSGIRELRGSLSEAILRPVRREQARALCADLGDALRIIAAPDTGLLRRAPRRSAVSDEAAAELERLQTLDVRQDFQDRLGTLCSDAEEALREKVIRGSHRLEDELNTSFTAGLRNSLPGRMADEMNAAWLDVTDRMQGEIATRVAEIGLGIELALPESGLPGYTPAKDLPPRSKRKEGRLGRLVSRVVRCIVMPWLIAPTIAEYHSEQMAKTVGLDRQGALTYVVRERNIALGALPGRLRNRYRGQVLLALTELTNARDTRLEVLRAVHGAVEDPPTREHIAAAQQRVSELQVLDGRLRKIATTL